MAHKELYCYTCKDHFHAIDKAVQATAEAYTEPRAYNLMRMRIKLQSQLQDVADAYKKAEEEATAYYRYISTAVKDSTITDGQLDEISDEYDRLLGARYESEARKELIEEALERLNELMGILTELNG